MKILNNLTLSQKIALEGEVAMALTGVSHNDELKYRLYMILKHLHSEYRDCVVEAIKKMITLDDCEFQKILWEVDQEEPPLYLWVNKCVSDIKMNAKPSEYSYAQGGPVSTDKAGNRQAIIATCFCRFVRAVAFCCSTAARALMTAIKADEELDFLHVACTYELEELRQLEAARPPKSKVSSTIMDMQISFNPDSMLSFSAETKSIKRREEAEVKNAERAKKLMNKAGDKEGFIEALDEVISSIVGETIEELAAEEKEQVNLPSRARYIVTKKFNGSELAIPLRDFKTRGEALEFIAELNKNFPELNKTCTFEITRKEWKNK